MTDATAQPIEIHVDADACPVKDEVYRVAARHGVAVKVVANGWMTIPKEDFIERVLVPAGPDVADDWIAERARPGIVVVTADVPLAARCVKAGATVLSPRGKPFSEASIGLTLATRDLMADLREQGMVTGGPSGFAKADRSRFLGALEAALVRLKSPGRPRP